jgi:tetratricopeptide (TPR) repeat protein
VTRWPAGRPKVALRVLTGVALLLAIVGGGFAKKDPTSAVGIARRALVDHPRDPARLCAMGFALLRAGRPAEAEPAFRSALAADPASVDAELGLGEVALARDDFAGAIAAYRRGLARAPGRADLHHQLGVAHALRGEFAEAVAHLEEADRLQPTWEGREDLARARADLLRSRSGR